MEYRNYLAPKSELYNYLYEFIIEENNPDQNFDYLKNLIDKQYKENSNEFKFVLYIIDKISKNNHRSSFLFPRIEQILLYYEDYIKCSFSNDELFNIFKSNRIILIFLFEKKLITLNETISTLLENQDNYKSARNNLNKYKYFFYSEIKPFCNNEYFESYVKKEMLDHDINIFDNFEINRKKGENDSYICQLIRQDSIKEFIIYMNKTNTSFSSKIPDSFFESNPFLIGKNTTLIEYAAFFGSFQIFKYLQVNNVDLTSSLWLYSIHGNNPELIHLLEENHVIPDDQSYLECLKESIKCHHNDIANYIESNLMSDKNFKINNENFIQNKIAYTFRYYNFGNLQDFSNEISFIFVNVSPFDFAAQKNNIAIINYLFNHGVDFEKSCFCNCKNLTCFSIPPGTKIIPDLAFCDCISLSEIIIPFSVESIGYCSFKGCYSLNQVLLPPNLKKIGERAFFQCYKLNQIEIPPSVTTIKSGAFNECGNLKKVKLSPLLKCIDGLVFQNCRSLKEINIPSSVTSILFYSFYGCHGLEKINFESPSSLTLIGNNSFNGCDSLKNISFPCSLTVFEISSFFFCSSITEIVIPSSVTKIGKFIFKYCSKLEKITFENPPSVTLIGEEAFANCTSLITIEIPSSVKCIENYAFLNCTSLKQVTFEKDSLIFTGYSSLNRVYIPTLLQSIANNAFQGCYSLKEIVLLLSLEIYVYDKFKNCTSIINK